MKLDEVCVSGSFLVVCWDVVNWGTNKEDFPGVHIRLDSRWVSNTVIPEITICQRKIPKLDCQVWYY